MVKKNLEQIVLFTLSFIRLRQEVPYNIKKGKPTHLWSFGENLATVSISKEYQILTHSLRKLNITKPLYYKFYKQRNR